MHSRSAFRVRHASLTATRSTRSASDRDQTKLRHASRTVKTIGISVVNGYQKDGDDDDDDDGSFDLWYQSLNFVPLSSFHLAIDTCPP
jgi:hypothetical protein